MDAKVLAIPLTMGIVFWALYHFTKKRPSPIIEKIKEKIALVDPSFRRLNISEGDRSETEDKSIITICTRDPETGKEYKINTLIYVTLHEIAHVLNKPGLEEHGSTWSGIFANLLDRAERVGIYKPSIPLEPLYCGIETGKASRISNPKVHHHRRRVRRSRKVSSSPL